MDAENFAKLTAILDLLDRYKKNLHQVVVQETTAHVRHQMGRALSRKSTRNGGMFDYGSDLSALSQHDAVAHALERRKTLKRAQTLLIRRRTRMRRSLPSLSEPASKSISLSCLDQELQEHVASRGLLHMFASRSMKERQESDPMDYEAQSDCLEYISELGSEPAPDVDWEEKPQSRRMSTASLEYLSTEDYSNLRPEVLGQLFDRILEYLQHDFEDLVERLKEQNGHLKQDVLSLRKKLHDAVETNDEQVQELKEMTERISDLEAEGRELSRQLTLMETRIKRYEEHQKALLKAEEEKIALHRERTELQERVKELSLQVSTQDTQKVTELAHDLVTLKGTTQAKDEEIKLLKRELDRKGRLLESLNVTLATQQITSMESPRGDLSSRQTTPRSSVSHLYAGVPNPRRVSVKQLLAMPPPVAPSEAPPSLATELQSTADAILPRRLTEVTEKLKSTLAEVESLRASNESLKEQLVEFRKEMEAKDSAMKRKLEERSQELAAAREEIGKGSEELKRTTEALEATKEDLRISNAVLQLTAADNEKLLEQVEEAKQMLRAAQERHADALAGRASPAVVEELEARVAELVEELRTKASLLDQSEKYKAELEEQRLTLQGRVEANMKQIEALSSRVASLEGQLVAATDIAAALDTEISKLMDLVRRGAVSNEESEDAEKQREALLALLEKERSRAASLAESVAQQRAVEAEQRDFEASALKLQRELQQQAAFLKAQLTKQEGETEAVRNELAQQESAAQKAKEELEQELHSTYGKLQELQERLDVLNQEKEDLEGVTEADRLQKAELTLMAEQRQEELRLRDEEIEQLQSELQQHIAKIQEYSSRQEAYSAEAERLREDISALELGLQAEKEETRRLLAIKEEEQRQVELAQQEALAAMQQQIDELKRDRIALLDAAAEAEHGKLRQDYDALLETVKSLREQNSSLGAELQNARDAQADESQQLLQKHQALLDNLSEAQEKYEELQRVLERSSAEYHRHLEDAQRQLAELQPQIAEMAAEHQRKEEQFKERVRQLEETRLGLQAEVSELKERNEEAQRRLCEAENQVELAGLRRQRESLAQQVDILQAHIRAKDIESAQALEQAEESQRLIQRLLASLEEQQQKLDEAEKLQRGSDYLSEQLNLARETLAESKAAEGALLRANERIRQENEGLKAEVDQLRSIMAERRAPDIAAVLEEVQRQLHDLAAEFTAFKNVESKQLMDLKGVVGGTTQVFNVSYPPFVIPLVNVHESKNTNDKTINISGMLDVRTAATGTVPSAFANAARTPVPALQGSRFQDWLCKWHSSWCTTADPQSRDACCTAPCELDEAQTDRWLTHTHAFKPTGKDMIQALRVHMKAGETFPRLEGPFHSSEDTTVPASDATRYSEIASATAC